MLKTAEERQEEESVAPNRECHFVAHPPNRNLKNTDSAVTMISEVLHDLLFNLNQLLKSADVY